MADRVAANIIIGGCVTPEQFETLAVRIAAEDLRVEWDGEPFDADRIEPNQPLRLYAYEVPWGSVEALEQYCCNQQIAYQRWSGSCMGSFGAERIVFDGNNGLFNFRWMKTTGLCCTRRLSDNSVRCTRSGAILPRPKSRFRRLRFGRTNASFAAAGHDLRWQKNFGDAGATAGNCVF